MRRKLSVRQKKETRDAYIFLAPCVIFFAIFVLYPFVYSFYLSLSQWDGGKITNITFSGIENYKRVFTDKEFYNSLKGTLIYTVGINLILIVASTYLAIVLNKKRLFQNFFKAAFFIPVVLPTTVCAAMFKWIFSAGDGLFNLALNAVGLPGQAWFQSPDLAMPSILIMSTWKWLGYNMVIIIAALQGIAEEYYEVGRLEGVNWFTKFRYITFPCIKPTLWFVVIIGIINSFQVFDQVYLLTRGGPLNRTMVLVYYMYVHAFEYYDLSYASAIAWVLFVILFILTAFQMRLSKAKD